MNALARLKQRHASVTPLAEWIEKTTGLAPPRHIREHLIPELEKAMWGPIRVAISMPPGHAKTVTVGNTLAWIAAHNPIAESAYVSYGDDLAILQSKYIRETAEAAGVQVASGGSKAWRTAQGGGVFAAGIGGGITGRRVKEGGVVVFDDPHKGRLEADSEVIRNSIWGDFKSAALTRIDSRSSVIVVQTRWHMDDVVGRLQELPDAKRWKFISLPAINDQGEPLWPEVYPLSYLEEKRSFDPWEFEGLYQQNPTPLGQQMFREPVRYDLAEFLKTLEPQLYDWCIAVDPAATAATHADFSAAFLCAMEKSGDDAVMRVVDVFHGQVEVPDLVSRVVAMRRAWMSRGVTARIAVEAVGLGKGLYQTIARLLPKDQAVPIKVSTDKRTRAVPVSAAWNDGRVLLPADARFDPVVREHRLFTGLGDKHDDQVDAMAYAWGVLWKFRPSMVRGERPNQIFELG